jgi:hypothetical protein
MKRVVLGCSIAALLAAWGCSVTTTTSPDKSGGGSSTTRCAALLGCCGALPADQVDACKAKANNPSSTDQDCYTEILQHYVDGYCDGDGNPLDGGRGAVDGSTTDAADGATTSDGAPPPPPESTCHTLSQVQCAQCCVANHQACVHAVRVADQSCVCTPSACASACASTYCSNPDDVPDTGSCADCLNTALTGACGSAADSVLSSNPDCTAEMTCLQSCPTK